MIRYVRLVLALVAGLGIAASLPAAPKAQDAPPLTQRDKVWPQSYSRLEPDAAARFGTLPNGMRYVVIHNATPTNQTALRMRVGSGSLEETDAQQGLAHFIEHMAFDGSTHVPQGEMVRILERHGLAFGADTNASTDWTQTVFQLDLPQSDDDTLDTGLMLMREAAGELTLAQKAVDGERGVVLSEERARDTPSYRAGKSKLDFILKGQLAARRMPIGQVDILRTAPADLLRSYYDAWYRPERTTVIAVGDFDAAAMEAKIKAKFSDWQARAPALPEPDLGTVATRGVETRLFVDPGASTSVSINWIKPFDAAPDGVAKRRRDLVEQIAFQVLNRRLGRQAHGERPPFLTAGAGADDELRSAKVITLAVSTDTDHWREGLLAADETRRRALKFGVRQDEVDREVTELRVLYQSAADGAATRNTPQVANEVAQSVDEQQVYTDPAADLALFQEAVQGLTADEVNKTLAAAFSGQGPLVFMTSPKPVDGGEAAVLAAFNEAETSTVTASEAETLKPWPYVNFGKPGAVAETRDVLDLDTSFIRFANGVRLTVKPTKFRNQQILISVRIGKGRSEIPNDHPTAAWAAGSVFIEGGLKAIDKEDMDQALASKIYNADLSIGDDAFVLSGATRPQDFDTQMQVLTAYVTAPGWRPEAYERMKTYGPNLLRQMQATPNGVLRRDLSGLLHGGDPRWTFPTLAQIDAGKPDDVRALLEKPLANEPIEVVIVGDITTDRAIEVVGATLGALPPRAEPTPPDPAELQVRFPTPTATPVKRTHTGRADQAVAYMAWPTGDFFADPQQQRALRLLQLVLERRLVDTIRIAQGATYSPSTNWDASLVYPGYGYVSASVEIPPTKIPGFYADVSKIAADLRDKEVSPDELERARKPHMEQIEKAQQTNEYWLGQLAGAATDPRRLDQIIRPALAGLERVRAADIRRVAQTYLTDARAWKMVVEAGDGAPVESAPLPLGPAHPAPSPARKPAPAPVPPQTPPPAAPVPAPLPEPAPPPVAAPAAPAETQPAPIPTAPQSESGSGQTATPPPEPAPEAQPEPTAPEQPQRAPRSRPHRG